MRRTFIILLLFSGLLQAQRSMPDALKPSFSHQYNYWQQDGYYFMDTTLNSLEWYHQLNNAFQDDFGQLTLTNMGGARNQITLAPLRPLLDYQSFGPYESYFTDPKTVKYYQVRSPLTDARYVTGYDRGQLFQIMHTQNVTKDWNVSLKYRRLNSLSFYVNDQNKQSSFLLNTQYSNPKGSYRLKAYVASEKMELLEFGGLLYDSIFTQNLENSRVLFLTRLDQDDREHYNRDYFLDHQVDFWKLFKKKKVLALDTLQDSTALAAEQPIAAKRSIILGHQLRFNRRAQVYNGSTNSSDNFYANYFFDQDGSYTDSMVFRNLYNEAYLQTIIGDSSRFDLKFGVFYQFLSYANDYFSTGAQNLGLSSNIKGNYKDFLNLQAEGSFVYGGDFANNFELKATGAGKIYKNVSAFASYHIQNKQPDLFEQLYVSNNVIWNQDLAPVLSNELTFGLQWAKTNYLRFKTFSANDMVYFNAEQNPMTAPEVVAYQSVDLVQNFSLFGWLHQDNQLSYQIPLSGAQYMPLPELVNRHSLYFQFPLFKGAIKILLGAEGTYMSSFQSASYSPAIGRMYLANEYPIGDYYIVDAFAQFKISKAVFFLKMQNVTEGLNPYNYWAAPHFPLNDRVFRFGINWRFFN